MNSTVAPLVLNSEEDIKAVEKSFMGDVKTSLTNLGPALISSRMQQQKILAESASQGGPADVQSAIRLLLDRADVGMRWLSKEVNQPRKKLLNMINGHAPMPPEVFDAIYDAIEKKKPGMMERLRNL